MPALNCEGYTQQSSCNETLGQRIGGSAARGQELLDLHRRTYRRYWQWSENVLNFAMLRGLLQASMGWTLHVGPDAKSTSLRNFPVQANGAEMLRLASCLVTEAGIAVCAPVHDALLIEASIRDIAVIVDKTRKLMEAAASVVLDGFTIRTEVMIVQYPDRYMDDRGKRMWNHVTQLLDEIPPLTGSTEPLTPVAPPVILISYP